RQLLANTIGREPVVLPATDLVGVCAGEHFADVVEPDTKARGLPTAEHARQKLLRNQRAVEGLARLQAVVAIVAALAGKTLAEVVQQFAAAAAGAFGVARHDLQLATRDSLLLRIGHLVEEVSLLGDVAAAEEQ